MRKRDLHSEQLKTLRIIQTLEFDHILGLHIARGLPSYSPAPHIVQVIKVDTEAQEDAPEPSSDFEVQQAFVALFGQLRKVNNAVIDLEFRRSLPFRITLEKDPREFEQ
jgi:hypothetical protein